MLSKGTKKFAIIILVFAALAGAFMLFGGSKKQLIDTTSTTSSGLVTSSGSAVVPGGPALDPTTAGVDDFAVLLSTIQTITIDTSLFQNPGYLKLKDNPIELGTDVIGRVNPFAPVGSDPVSASSGALAVVTIQPGKITSTTAELAGQVTLTDTQPVTVMFEYGLTDTFGTATTPTTVTHTGSFFTTVKNLLPGTTYNVRAVATKGSIATPANIMTFTTSGSAQQ